MTSFSPPPSPPSATFPNVDDDGGSAGCTPRPDSTRLPGERQRAPVPGQDMLAAARRRHPRLEGHLRQRAPAPLPSATPGTAAGALRPPQAPGTKGKV